MGGRGASSGISAKGKKYGTEYRTILSIGNVKYIKQNGPGGVKTPMETMSKNRVYVTIKEDDRIKAVTFYDKDNKRYKTIDVTGKPHKINGKAIIPHTHHGYFHDENGTTALTARESRCRFVNHMLHIALKESRTSLGDFHCNGFMGKLLYSLFLTASCFLKSSNEKNR